ncbi:hypothetical protein BJX64DRAFT_271041 [Aspergillus heterothallicus]
MFHGGTNWDNNAYNAITTSYDYGAPLDASGRPNAIYHALRSMIAARFDGIPDVPIKPPMSSTHPIHMKSYLSLFDALPHKHSSVNTPQTFEQLGQKSGFLLYAGRPQEPQVEPSVSATVLAIGCWSLSTRSASPLWILASRTEPTCISI